MVAELNVLNEWIPEQMQPGTIFVLENAGRVGEKEDPYWAVLVLSRLRHPRPDHAQTACRPAARNLRLRPVFRAILHQRQ